MDEATAVLRHIIRSERAARFGDSPQWSLGQFIDALKAITDQTLGVTFDFPNSFPAEFESWRGSYDELALTYERYGSAGMTTVAALLELATAADGETFTGWKGGNFDMDRSTPLWVANRGESGQTVVSGVSERLDWVVIHTAYGEY